MKRFFYKPYWAYLLADALTLLLSVVIVLAWFPLSTKIPFQKYDVFAIIFSTIWLMSSYLCRRYIPVRYMRMDKDIRQLIFSAIFTFGCMYGYMWLKSGKHFSIWVLLTIWLVMLVMSLLYLIIKHAYRYARPYSGQDCRGHPCHIRSRRCGEPSRGLSVGRYRKVERPSDS